MTRHLLLLLSVLVVTEAAASPQVDLSRAQAALEALVRGAVRGPDGRPLFPPDLRLDDLGLEDGTPVLRVSGSFGTVPALAEVIDDLRLETWLGALAAAGVEGGVRLLVRAPDGSYRPIGLDAPDVAVPSPVPVQPRPPSPFLRKLPLGGALEGRRIAVSAGHGWIDDGSGGWRTQRSLWKFEGCGACRGVLEDYYNAEMMSRYVIPLLENMGAEVVAVREPDHDLLAAVTVDDGDGAHRESGTWSTGTSEGGHAGDYRVAAPEVADAAAHFDLTAGGRRRVALRFVEGANRTSRSLVTVRHAGGERTLEIDQRAMGRFWHGLGWFEFLPGEGGVSLTRGAGDGYLIADAVKFGGGVFSTSGKPWWEMGAKSFVPWSEAPASVTQYSDVSIRPAYAEFVGADAYISMHGNAAGSSGSGTDANGISTYRYSCSTYPDYTRSDSATGCDDPPGSRRLIDLVHPAMLARIRADWDPNFSDRGKIVANFGEVRTLDDTPGILIESAFFDNLANPRGDPPPKYADNRSMQDPRWREALAYGLAEGLAKFFDPNAGAPPPRPEGLYARNRADGVLEVGWRPVPGAEGYQVYLATRGRGFDPGPFVTGTSTFLDALDPRTVYFLRVAAVNANGEGYASQAVAARYRGARNPRGEPAEALILYAYDRRDAWVQQIDNDLAYAVEHGEALGDVTDGDLFFDGVLDEAVEDGTLPLDGYRLIDYVAGKDSSEHLAVGAGMQSLLRAYVQGGGKLVASGEEIAYQLGNGSDADRAFLSEVLGATYAADDADTFTLRGAPTGPFADVADVSFDDGTRGVYEVRYPDVLAAPSGAAVAMTYPDGTAAAVFTDSVVTFGVPLEAVVPRASRAALFDAAVAFLVPGLPLSDLDLDGASDTCEQQYGLDWRDGSDGNLDADGDGVSNADECRAGTDPTQANPQDGGTPVTDGGTPITDGGVSEDGGLPATDGGAEADGGSPHVDDREVTVITGSCGCATGPGGPGAGVLLILALILPLGARAFSGRGEAGRAGRRPPRRTAG